VHGYSRWELHVFSVSGCEALGSRQRAISCLTRKELRTGAPISANEIDQQMPPGPSCPGAIFFNQQGDEPTSILHLAGV